MMYIYIFIYLDVLIFHVLFYNDLYIEFMFVLEYCLIYVLYIFFYFSSIGIECDLIYLLDVYNFTKRINLYTYYIKNLHQGCTLHFA